MVSAVLSLPSVTSFSFSITAIPSLCITDSFPLHPLLPFSSPSVTSFHLCITDIPFPPHLSHPSPSASVVSFPTHLWHPSPSASVLFFPTPSLDHPNLLFFLSLFILFRSNHLLHIFSFLTLLSSFISSFISIIYFSSFHLIYRWISSESRMRAQVMDCFNAIDVEHNGFITVADIAMMLKNLGESSKYSSFIPLIFAFFLSSIP